MDNNPLLFHASSASKLMTDAKGARFTEKDAARLLYLETKKTTPKKLTAHQEARLSKILGIQKQYRTAAQYRDLKALVLKRDTPEGITDKQEQELKVLKAKKKAPFQLSATAKSLVAETYLEQRYGFKKVVLTKAIQKGKVQERKAIKFYNDTMPCDDFRVQNTKQYKNDHFIGTPDLDLRGMKLIEDIKCSWDLWNFFHAQMIDDYYGQLQVYMDLLGYTKASLVYVLMPTPPDMIQDILIGYFYKIGSDQHPDYIEIEEQIHHNNNLIEMMDPKERIKRINIVIDHKYLTELKWRVEKAREYYQTLVVNGINKNIDKFQFAAKFG